MMTNLTIKISVCDLISIQWPSGPPDDLNLTLANVMTLLRGSCRFVPGRPQLDPWIELDLSGIHCDVEQTEAPDVGLIDTGKGTWSPRIDRLGP